MVIRIPFPEEVPQAPPNVFSLATPQHMLGKFSWELRQLKAALQSPSDNPFEYLVPVYHAFNCAVTGWHLVDWTWGSVEPDERPYAAKFFGFTLHSDNRRNLTALANAIASDCPELHACRWIANGSKHMRLERPDQEIRAKTEDARWKGGEYRLWVEDADTVRSVDEIFDGAFRYWCSTLRQLGFIEASILGVDE